MTNQPSTVRKLRNAAAGNTTSRGGIGTIRGTSKSTERPAKVVKKSPKKKAAVKKG